MSQRLIQGIARFDGSGSYREDKSRVGEAGGEDAERIMIQRECDRRKPGQLDRGGRGRRSA